MDKAGCEVWLNSLWRSKEAKLKKFYEKDKKFEPSGSRYVWPLKTTGLGYWIAFSWWVFTSIMWSYFTYQYFFVKFYVFLGSSFYIYALKYHNGVEFLIIKWFYRRFPDLRKDL
ncbi:unnamed protein product, partial [Mesorhabditis belari]|uniref:Uncharacterized protein n=1 Tax=Mesorhabditis belari TaxID=2138241 RepID=A0AAF3EEM3_9BILA